MKTLVVFTFTVLTYFVLDCFHAQTNSALYAQGVEAYLNQPKTVKAIIVETGISSPSRGPAIEIKPRH